MPTTKTETSKFKLTLKSNNHKTGKMPVSTSPMQSCPETCPFRGRGCYGNYGPMLAWWRRCSQNTNSTTSEYQKFIDQVTEIPDGQVWRHNQAGDLLSKDGETIDTFAALSLVTANKYKDGYTYTHYGVVRQKDTCEKAAGKNRTIIEIMNRMGFTVNISCNSLAHADRVVESGINAPITVMVPEQVMKDGTKRFKTPAGNTVMMCPNVTKGITCVECMLCMKPKRKVIIAFPCHGSGKKRAEEVLKEWATGDHVDMEHVRTGRYQVRHTYHAGIDGLENE